MYVSLKHWVQDLDTGEYLYPALGGGSPEDNEDFILNESEYRENREDREPRQSMAIPKHRFDEVNSKYKQTSEQLAAYSKFGTPEEIQKAIERAKAVPQTEEELSAYDEQLRRIPAFRKVYEAHERDEQNRKVQREAFLNNAENKFKDYANELGVPVEDQGLLYDIQAQVAEQIRRDPGLAARFRANDMSSVDDAYKRASSTGLISMLKRSKKNTVRDVKTRGVRQPSNPRAVGKGEDSNESRHMTERQKLQAAAERGFELLNSQKE